MAVKPTVHIDRCLINAIYVCFADIGLNLSDGSIVDVQTCVFIFNMVSCRLFVESATDLTSPGLLTAHRSTLNAKPRS